MIGDALWRTLGMCRTHVRGGLCVEDVGVGHFFCDFKFKKNCATYLLGSISTGRPKLVSIRVTSSNASALVARSSVASSATKASISRLSSRSACVNAPANVGSRRCVDVSVVSSEIWPANAPR